MKSRDIGAGAANTYEAQIQTQGTGSPRLEHSPRLPPSWLKTLPFWAGAPGPRAASGGSPSFDIVPTPLRENNVQASEMKGSFSCRLHPRGRPCGRNPTGSAAGPGPPALCSRGRMAAPSESHCHPAGIREVAPHSPLQRPTCWVFS